jgi:crotonobetainyl-CoA:carnitine CoA-transferase CaiB-like acyl-CoA transferase
MLPPLGAQTPTSKIFRISSFGTGSGFSRANFIASLPAEEVYHAAQQRGFTWGAVRAPEALLDDPHLNDRGFWKEVAHPELGRSFVYPGEAAIYNSSPWRISRRAPLIGEHNVEIFCAELGLSRSELSVLAENRVI